MLNGSENFKGLVLTASLIRLLPIRITATWFCSVSGSLFGKSYTICILADEIVSASRERVSGSVFLQVPSRRDEPISISQSTNFDNLTLTLWRVSLIALADPWP